MASDRALVQKNENLPIFASRLAILVSGIDDFKWRHSHGEIILWDVLRSYCKYGISYRELETMLREQGLEMASNPERQPKPLLKPSEPEKR